MVTRVAIVGCGIVGAAIAYELSHRPDLDITVLEQHSSPAQAATGAALGVLTAATSTKAKGLNFKMRLRGIQRYDEWIPALEASTGLRIPYNRQGILRLCFTEEPLDSEDFSRENGDEDLAGENLVQESLVQENLVKKYSDEEILARWRSLVAIRQTQGLHLEMYDRDQLAARYPQLGLAGVIGGVYAPSDRQLDPTATTAALVAAAQQNGVNFHFGAAVVAIDADTATPAHCQTIHTATESLAADWLIIAAGLGTLPLTVQLNQRVDIRPVLGQAVHLRLAQPLGDRQPVITEDDVHVVPLAGGEYWIGATVEFPVAMPRAIARQQPSPQRLAELMQKAIAICPALRTGEILRTWSGLRPRPEGRPAPIVEILSGYANVIVAAGHYRNGVLLAPTTAERVRELMALSI